MRYLLILLGISLTSGSIFGIITALYRIVQLRSGLCSPSSSDEMMSLLSPQKIVRIGTIAGGLLGGGVVACWMAVTGAFPNDWLRITVSFLVIFLLAGIVGAFAGGWASGVGMLVALILHTVVFFLGSRLVFSRLGFTTIICQHCLQYTSAPASYYKSGTRFCEHCQKAVEQTREPGKVVLTFGAISLDTPERTIIRRDTDFGHLSPSDDTATVFLRPSFEETYQHRSIDVSEVYIDTKTCDPILLEKFLTHIINYPPKRGLGSIRIFYRESLDGLGDNLKNALQNTFRHVEQIH